MGIGEFLLYISIFLFFSLFILPFFVYISCKFMDGKKLKKRKIY